MGAKVSEFHESVMKAGEISSSQNLIPLFWGVHFKFTVLGST